MLKTNNKSVRQAVHDHISEHFDDFDNFKHDVQAVGSISELVKGGALLCYYDDVREFLKTILEESDQECAKYSDDLVWSLYINLIIMEGQKILNKGSF
jgi:hypothetical protein